MKALEWLQKVVVRLARPFAGVRGTGRLCRLANEFFLGAGVQPVQIAQMSDGTRMRLDLRSETEWYAFYSGQYDDASVKAIKQLMKQLEGDFLDVGGNIGMYAVRVVAGLNPERRCHCFEPMPNNAARIRENANLNGIHSRIQIYQTALSDCDGETELVLREDFEAGSATGNASVAISDEADGSFRKICVPMRRLDGFFADLADAKFPVAKVDIEGHEDFFLRGAAEWLNRDRPVILTEINNWFYKKRGTTSSAAFLRTLPHDYEIALLRTRGKSCVLEPCTIGALADLQRVETCLVYPKERSEVVRQATK